MATLLDALSVGATTFHVGHLSSLSNFIESVSVILFIQSYLFIYIYIYIFIYNYVQNLFKIYIYIYINIIIYKTLSKFNVLN